VLQHSLDVFEILFGYLHSRLAHIPRFSIPESDEVVAFILRPLVKVVVVLYPVFTKFCPDILRIQLHTNDRQQKEGQKNIPLHGVFFCGFQSRFQDNNFFDQQIIKNKKR
jgi:hypothetical protein